MSRDPPRDSREIDRIACALHAEAVDRVPARTLMRLRAPRAPAPTTRPAVPALAWSLAAAGAAVVAIALGLGTGTQRSVAPDDAPLAAVPADGSYVEAYAALDEDPDFYLWLATTDVQPLAVE